MNTFKLKIIILAFGSVFLTSCTQLMFTSLDVLRPAKMIFEPDANNLLIVNNTITQPAVYGHKTQLYNENAKYVMLNTDSLSLFCLGSLKEELEAKNFFSTVQLLADSRNDGKDFSTITRLNADTVKNLCNTYHADVVLSLDKIKENDDLSEFYLPESSTYLSTLEIKFETYWTVLYPGKNKPTTIQFKDTIYWESESYYRKKGMSGLPKRADALIDGALYVGQKTVNRFVPYWEKVDRYFFMSNNRFIKQGMDSVYVKNWNAAIDIWQKAIGKNKNNRTQALALNNIAVAYEILGDIDKALDYATRSYYTFSELNFADTDSSNRLIEYTNDLAQRKNEIDLLKKQLGEK